ncbi:MAG: flippase-like domain-containing protein [Actinomycetota bacterium]|nr:flippase-like domain-containing protein [Actinomycetota bacterium]
MTHRAWDPAVTRSDPAANAPVPGPPAEQDHHDEEMPRVHITRERVLIFGLFVVSAIAFLYFALPRFAGLGKTWDRLGDGDPAWIAAAAVFEMLSFGGYILLFRTVFVRGKSVVDWRESYQITMAGLAATRLFAAAGAGGIALTAWALRRSGMERRIVACRMVAFMFLLYAVFGTSLVIVGIGLRTGVFGGSAPFALTILPAIVGAVAIAVFLAVALLPHDFERRLAGWATGTRHPRLVEGARRVATVPASMASGVRTAIGLVRERNPGVLGAPAWWAFDIAVLWASFHAFGTAPPTAVLVLAYFLGQVGNTLPVPGGIGGVDGALIGAFIAFGTDTGLAIVAVLVYRAFSFWLPTLPGAVAYLQLRRTVRGWRDHARQAPAQA